MIALLAGVAMACAAMGQPRSMGVRHDGPWTQEPQPITPPGYGHSMLFKRFDGQWVMSVHHHSKDDRGRTVRVPHLFEVDLSGDKLVLGKQIQD